MEFQQGRGEIDSKEKCAMGSEQREGKKDTATGRVPDGRGTSEDLFGRAEETVRSFTSSIFARKRDPQIVAEQILCDRDLAKKQNYIRDPSSRNHCHHGKSSRHGLGRAVITKRLSLIQKMQRGYHKGPKFHCQAKRQQN